MRGREQSPLTPPLRMTTTIIDRICPIPKAFPLRTTSLMTPVVPMNESMVSGQIEYPKRFDSLNRNTIIDVEQSQEQEMTYDEDQGIPSTDTQLSSQIAQLPTEQQNADVVVMVEMPAAEPEPELEPKPEPESEPAVADVGGQGEAVAGQKLVPDKSAQELPSAAPPSSSDNSTYSAPATSPVQSSEVQSRARSLSRSLSSRLRRASWLPSRSPSPKKHGLSEDSSWDIPTIEISPRHRSSRRERNSDMIRRASKSQRRESSFSRHITQKLRKPSKSHINISTEGNIPSSLDTNQTSSSLPDLRAADKKSAKQSNDTAKAVSASEKSSMPSSTETVYLGKVARGKVGRKRDDLWTTFRTLDSDCSKFESKLPEAKGGFVRSTLIKFLELYKSHPSNHKLRPEDLDRRATILHRWWILLISFIGGRLYLTLSPKDRTSLLDCVTGIMERPEWRSPPSPFSPTKDKRSSYPPSHSTESTSLSSESVDLVMESVQHNIRTMFVQALLAQMAVVLERMSMRNNPPSMVVMGGKTCAYAFFFCPGLGKALVKLWNPSIDIVRRVLSEHFTSPSVDLSATVDRISSSFPAALADLHFSSLSELSKDLHTPPRFPFGTEALPWRGCWLEKWRGQESDLFYTFVREYHLLLFEYLPQVSKPEMLAAPGFLFVQAQILRNMDDTINRNLPKSFDFQQLFQRDGLTRLQEERRGPSNITFDDVLNDPDSTAMSIPLGPSMNQVNADRQMGENRLIILLRETLNSKNSFPKHYRDTFASLFAFLLRAAAKRVDQFDRAACETLCDFLEETVVILVRYEQENDFTEPFLDWPFWFLVWKKMLDSHNYFTDLRVCCLIYSIWPAIAMDPQRKTDFCFDFLLEPSFFQSKFCHWSPMVRAYYMRLMCWRVARCNEDVVESDLKIVDCLRIRLRETYSYYLFLCEEARKNDELLPSTSPSNAAPGRRVTVMRTEPGQGASSFLPYDGAALYHAAYKRSLILDKVCSIDSRPQTAHSHGSSTASDGEKDAEEKQTAGISKRWTGGLLRTIISTSKQGRGRSKSPGGRFGGKAPTSTPQPQTRTMVSDSVDHQLSDFSAASQLSHRTYCFRFAMEMIDRRMQTQPSMILQTPKLPQPAQILLGRGLSFTPPDSNENGNSKPSSILLPKEDSHISEETGIPQQRESMASSESTSPVVNSESLRNTPLPRNHGLIIQPIRPPATLRKNIVYAGRSLAEWTLVVNDCQAFFDRRKVEGVPGNRYVETPLLSTDAFRPR